MKSVSLEQVATKVNGLFTYDYSKHKAAKELGLSDYLFNQMSQKALVAGEQDNKTNKVSYCSLYYLKKTALAAMKVKNLEFADAAVACIRFEDLTKILSFNNQNAIQNCIEIFDLDNKNIAKVIIYGLTQGNKMERLFDRVRQYWFL